MLRQQLEEADGQLRERDDELEQQFVVTRSVQTHTRTETKKKERKSESESERARSREAVSQSDRQTDRDRQRGGVLFLVARSYV